MEKVEIIDIMLDRVIVISEIEISVNNYKSHVHIVKKFIYFGIAFAGWPSTLFKKNLNIFEFIRVEITLQAVVFLFQACEFINTKLIDSVFDRIIKSFLSASRDFKGSLNLQPFWLSIFIFFCGTEIKVNFIDLKCSDSRVKLSIGSECKIKTSFPITFETVLIRLKRGFSV
jgi:hypothetical protein